MSSDAAERASFEEDVLILLAARLDPHEPMRVLHGRSGRVVRTQPRAERDGFVVESVALRGDWPRTQLEVQITWAGEPSQRHAMAAPFWPTAWPDDSDSEATAWSIWVEEVAHTVAPKQAAIAGLRWLTDPPPAGLAKRLLLDPGS